jgi:MFS superfamily sulfate permease-like transporter
LRVDAQLYYANALTARDRVKAMIAEMESPPRAVIFDATSQDQLDLTTTEAIRGLMKELHEKGIDLYLAEIHAPVLEHGRRMGLLEFIGEDHVYPTVDLAVQSISVVDRNKIEKEK